MARSTSDPTLCVPFALEPNSITLSITVKRWVNCTISIILAFDSPVFLYSCFTQFFVKIDIQRF